MKRLSKATLEARDDLVKRLRDAAVKIEPAVEAANAAIEEYNAILADVETFRDEVVGEMETYVDERSEKWQESDAASSYQDWKGEFESLDPSTVEEFSVPDLEMADALEALPETPEG